MWWAVDPGFSTCLWSRWDQIVVTLFDPQIHRKSISKDDKVSFQLFEFIATYIPQACYSIVKTGNMCIR
jgi:hypothetical protein